MVSAIPGWPATEPTLIVTGPRLTATVLPERGGKISSLRDDVGVEWLAQPDRAVGAPARPGADFLNAEMAGWDECAPTIVECVVDGVALADHGELWTKGFETTDLGVSTTDDTLGYRFWRDITPTDDGLRFDYRVESLGGAIPFLWAAHPQFIAPAGTWVRLPGQVNRVVDVLDPGLPVVDWHGDLGHIDSIEPGGCRKLYVHPDEPAFEAGLVRPDGSELTLRWSNQCPYLGLWLDRFSYRAEPIIAIEPATSYFDSLATAVQLGRAPTISPAAPLSWWLELSVTR
jgi:hypothetical protein